VTARFQSQVLRDFALLQGGSPAMREDLRKRFDTYLNERCKGKDVSKLHFAIE
jgi:hypothetical protein